MGRPRVGLYPRPASRSERPYDDVSGRLYRASPPLNIAPLYAAVMVTTCVAQGPCDPEPHRTGRGPQPSFSYARMGDFVPIARSLRVEAARAPLLEAGLHPDAVDAFLVRAEASRRRIVEWVEDTSPRLRAIYVETPETVRSRRATERLTLASLFARLHRLTDSLDAAIVDGQVTVGLIQAARSLRGDTIDACRRLGRSLEFCLNGPIGRPLTERLVQMHVQRSEWLDARAEVSLLRSGPDLSDPRYEIHEAVGEAIRKERHDFAAYRRALALGLSQKVLEERFGESVPLELSGSLAWSNVAGVQPPTTRRDELGNLVDRGNRDAGNPALQVFEGELLSTREDGRLVCGWRWSDAAPTSRTGSALGSPKKERSPSPATRSPSPSTPARTTVGSYEPIETRPSCSSGDSSVSPDSNDRPLVHPGAINARRAPRGSARCRPRSRCWSGTGPPA